MGAVFSNITCRLIVAQMSSTEAPLFNTLLIPLAILVVAIWMPNGKVRWDKDYIRGGGEKRENFFLAIWMPYGMPDKMGPGSYSCNWDKTLDK